MNMKGHYMPASLGKVEIHNTASEVARRHLQPEDCALLVVDIQERLLPPIFNKDLLVRNTKVLIHLAQLLHIPIVASTQYSRGLGHTVPDVACLLDGVPTLDKVEFGCFSNRAFCDAFKSLPGERNTVLLCGMETHICVMQTALGALNRGYLVHVASDAVGSRTEWNWQVGLRRMEVAGAIISSTEMMMYELMRASGTPVFKEMLQHLK
jgi:nicotinamidase-related amidase